MPFGTGDSSPPPSAYQHLPAMDPEECASLLPADGRVGEEDAVEGDPAADGASDPASQPSMLLRPRSASAVPASDEPSPRRARSLSSVLSASGIGLTAVSRWQQTAARIVHASRLSDAIGEAMERYEPGAAPGIDPRRSKYQHLAAKWCLPSTVTVVDYDAGDAPVQTCLSSAEELRDFLAIPRTRRVRWIHVDGLNWEVIQLLALTYDLHPLALEDTVHVPQRIKADFYDSCLYVSLIYLYLAARQTEAPPPSNDPNGRNGHHKRRNAAASKAAAAAAAAAAATAARPHHPRTISSARRGETEAAAAAATAAAADVAAADLEDGGGAAQVAAGVRRRPRVSQPGPTHYPLALHRGAVTVAGAPAAGAGAGAAVPAGGSDGGGSGSGAGDGGGCGSSASTAVGGAGAGQGGRSVHVSAQQVSLFLLRGEHPNTLITVFQSDGSAVTRPIRAQLQEPRTLVREVEDASFLANLVVDTLVDHIFPVVAAFTDQLQQYEVDVMGGGVPSGASTRELHAMQRDLRRINRTIAPLQAVVANMVARDATACDLATVPSRASSHPPSHAPSSSNLAAPSASASAPSPAPSASSAPSAPSAPHSSSASAPPFLSRLTRTYLGDVRDHVSTICEDLMSLSTECGDLIGLIFNLATHQQAQSTQTLAVVSTIFLPITFLAGVYGMNFDNLPELHLDFGYPLFWVFCALIVVAFILVMRRAGLWSN